MRTEATEGVSRPQAAEPARRAAFGELIDAVEAARRAGDMSRSKFDQLWKSGQAPQPHVTRVARNNRPRYQRWLAWHIDLWNEMGQPSELAAFTKRVRAEQERRR